MKITKSLLYPNYLSNIISTYRLGEQLINHYSHLTLYTNVVTNVTTKQVLIPALMFAIKNKAIVLIILTFI